MIFYGITNNDIHDKIDFALDKIKNAGSGFNKLTDNTVGIVRTTTYEPDRVSPTWGLTVETTKDTINGNLTLLLKFTGNNDSTSYVFDEEDIVNLEIGTGVISGLSYFHANFYNPNTAFAPLFISVMDLISLQDSSEEAILINSSDKVYSNTKDNGILVTLDHTLSGEVSSDIDSSANIAAYPGFLIQVIGSSTQGPLGYTNPEYFLNLGVTSDLVDLDKIDMDIDTVLKAFTVVRIDNLGKKALAIL